MRILFSSPHCLLDGASGAAHSVRTLLSGLASRGHEVRALTGSVLDGAGQGLLASLAGAGELTRVESGGVEHTVLGLRSTRARRLLAREEAALLAWVERELDAWRPDAVLTYGAFLFTRLLLAEARARGIRTGFYLAAGGYRDSGAFDDADAVFAVSSAAAAEAGLAGDSRVSIISSLVALDDYRVGRREPRHVVFVNPQAAKGVAVFAAVAELSERLGRPHRFLVVESRGSWASALAALPSLADRSNVSVWTRRADMREVYALAHTLMFPSLWFEAAGRVLREAGINGIPVVAHRVGGVAETVTDGLVLLDPPAALRDDWMAPVPSDFARAWLDCLDRLRDDAAHYAERSSAIRASVERYSLDELVSRVEAALGGATPGGAAPGGPSLGQRQVPR